MSTAEDNRKGRMRIVCPKRNKLLRRSQVLELCDGTRYSRPMIMNVANDPDPDRPLGLSYVLNIDPFLGSIVIGMRAQVLRLRSDPSLCLSRVRAKWRVEAKAVVKTRERYGS